MMIGINIALSQRKGRMMVSSHLLCTPLAHQSDISGPPLLLPQSCQKPFPYTLSFRGINEDIKAPPELKLAIQLFRLNDIFERIDLLGNEITEFHRGFESELLDQVH